jgi:hypothetical protein
MIHEEKRGFGELPLQAFGMVEQKTHFTITLTNTNIIKKWWRIE